MASQLGKSLVVDEGLERHWLREGALSIGVNNVLDASSDNP